MGLASIAVKKAVPYPRPERFDRFLFIGPHPDDIEIGAGATVARLAAAGKAVTFLICLDGRFGLSAAPEGTTKEELAEIRKREAVAAAKVLGVTDVRFLGLSDGGFYGMEELRTGIARAVGEVQPQVIFGPDPSLTSECHPDHLNVAECVRRLAYFCSIPQIMAGIGAVSAPVEAVAFYMTARPNRFVATGAAAFEKQMEAIRCHRSQYPEGSEEYSTLCRYLKLRSFDAGLRSFRGRAEGFRVLGALHMHCCAEAG